MNTEQPFTENLPQPPNDGGEAPYIAEAAPNRPWMGVLLSWIAILLVTIGIFTMHVVGPYFQSEPTEAGGAEMFSFNVQAKMLIGQTEILPTQNIDEAQLDGLNIGSPEQRYGVVFLQNELFGAEKAQSTLDAIDEFVAKEKDVKLNTDQKRLRAITGRLIKQYSKEKWDSSMIAKKDRDFLVSKLGWVGKLGLTPVNSPNTVGRERVVGKAARSAIVMLLMCGVGGLSLLAGLGGVVIFSVMLAKNNVRSSYFVQTQRSHIYIETFAIWLVGFFAIQLGAGSVIDFFLGAGDEVAGAAESPVWLGSVITLGIFFGSLVVLFWPVSRGIPFSQVRTDIGWTFKNPIKEIGAGVAAYFSMLPLMIVGGIISLILVFIIGLFQSSSAMAPTGGASHPIQEQIATGNITIWIGVFLTACVAAPIVEETMFRGVFYRYLRDANNRRAARWMSVAIAAFINGLIFAAIHPQGIVGIPLLTTLAIGMCLAREWRDSLIAPITMHAMNNTFVTCLMFAIF